MSGPYAVAAFSDAVFYGQVGRTTPLFLTFTATGYQKAYGDVYASPTDIFEARYATGIESLLPSAVPRTQLFADGKLPRDHQFDPKDGRRKYPMFAGDEWTKNQDFLDKLRPLAEETGRTLAQVVLNWTIQRTGITVALSGAKRPDQIHDNAATMTWQLTQEQIARIDAAIVERGNLISRGAFT